MRLIELLNTDQPPAAIAERFWLEPGARVRLGAFCWMLVDRWRHVGEERRRLQLRLRTPASRFAVPAQTVINLADTCGIRIVPLALERQAGEDEARRVFIEFQGIAATGPWPEIAVA